MALLLKVLEVKFAADGEILCKRPECDERVITRSAPDLTAEVIDKDGWFHTGDIGELVDGRFLKITDREKRNFQRHPEASTLHTQALENKFKESRRL